VKLEYRHGGKSGQHRAPYPGKPGVPHELIIGKQIVPQKLNRPPEVDKGENVR